MPFVPDDEWEAILTKQASLEKRVAELEALLRKFDNAHTPSSIQGFHANNSGENKSHGKPGRKDGHEGMSRKIPQDIHERRLLKLKVCPCCEQKVKLRKNSRKRVVTTIVPGTVKNTEYELQRAYCENCDKLVEPVVPNALPNTPFGLELALYVAFLSMLGITLSKIRTILQHDYSLTLSKGAIANMLEKTASFLGVDYEKLREELLKQSNIFGDETSHPIHGKNGWLWTFISEKIAYLTVQKSRGQKVANKILKGYAGILHSDFWSAYNKLKCDKQKCLAHLFRELKHLRKKSRSKELKKYCSELLRLLDYARKENRHSSKFREFCEQRLQTILDRKYSDKDCLRLNKRLQRHSKEIFLFAEKETEITNNRAERSLRPMVIKRKNTYGSYSLEGAQAHAVLASFYQTSQLQNQNFEDYMKGLIQDRLNPTGS